MSGLRIFMGAMMKIVVIFVAMSEPTDSIFLPFNVAYERLPIEITGMGVEKIAGYGDLGLLLKSQQNITIYGDSTVTMMSVPMEMRIDDIVADAESGYMFLSSGKTIYALSVVNGHMNKFLTVDTYSNCLTIGCDVLYVHADGGSKLLKVPLVDGVSYAESLDLGGVIDDIAPVGDRLIVVSEGRMALISTDEIIPFAQIGYRVNAIAATDDNWIAYCTDKEVGIVDVKGCKLKLRTTGAKELHYEAGILYIVDLDGRVSVFLGWNSM